ncbi:Sensor histidine kinase VraS [Lacticaseibacillus rhamnosus LOCK908]|jgi:NarL family two-component system sensor histidine kinase LiaS|nr:histidine kinase-, DNA gyrase B-, and HSP90-like ATPase family protein [Lacticaseibacillus rhamnosus ATCC 8530]AGP74384.1 Sensor histidine kinase VraS [Lacticaseibacillus rhamnosus LOCK908]KRK32187.1 histidine kinase-, dna gyrase b-, and hsp90-like atpase family protein [Lacticaseibacillus rhamnosus DSM 20021 = JCM 1136 = NBRC 3425]
MLVGFFMILLVWTLLVEACLVFMLAKVTQHDFLRLLLANVLSAPLLVYLLIGALLISSGVTVIVLWRQRVVRSQLDSRLAQLNAGQYQAPIFNRSQQAEAALGKQPAALLEALRQKMIRLQREIERYSNTPVRFSGETREAILTGERHRLARELHDSVSQQLFAAMMMLSALRSVAARDPKQEALNKQLDTIQKVINEAQAEMRALLLHLRPTNLEGKSLKQGIIQLLKELQTKITIKITWQLDDIQLNAAAEDNLFRIVQELLSNTLRHAKADSLEVYLKRLQDMVILRMVDDGVGFDPKETSSNGNYGLANIKERAAAMGGTAKVVSVVGQGTSVEVRVPLSKDVAHD